MYLGLLSLEGCNILSLIPLMIFALSPPSLTFDQLEHAATEFVRPGDLVDLFFHGHITLEGIIIKMSGILFAAAIGTYLIKAFRVSRIFGAAEDAFAVNDGDHLALAKQLFRGGDYEGAKTQLANLKSESEASYALAANLHLAKGETSSAIHKIKLRRQLAKASLSPANVFHEALDRLRTNQLQVPERNLVSWAVKRGVPDEDIADAIITMPQSDQRQLEEYASAFLSSKTRAGPDEAYTELAYKFPLTALAMAKHGYSKYLSTNLLEIKFRAASNRKASSHLREALLIDFLGGHQTEQFEALTKLIEQMIDEKVDQEELLRVAMYAFACIPGSSARWPRRHDVYHRWATILDKVKSEDKYDEQAHIIFRRPLSSIKRRTSASVLTR
jgi:hypothetical protein